MTLAQRLARLVSPPGSVALDPDPPVRASGLPAALGAAEPSPGLEGLRRQLQALLERNEPLQARPAPDPGPRRRAAWERLPFVARDTPFGPFWQRLERLTGSHRVGSVALEQLGLADPRVLAELALDPSIAGSSPSSWLFLDTETTGLGGAGTLAFLVGMGSLDADGGAVLEQLVLREPGQERPLLERVAERFHAASLIVSFNGKAFDRPLLEGRYVMNRLPPLPRRPHLDLLHVARRLHRERLGSCSLKRLERDVLGFERGPDLDGSEVAAVYGHFLRSADTAGMAAVVAHNLWDVASMLALVGLYGQRLPPLAGVDLASLARTLHRAGAAREAERTADAACQSGGGVDALRVRAQIAKARGDAASATRDLELVCAEVDDPAGRLELAKLYEHQLRSPARALEWLGRGTTESEDAHARRRARLARKLGLC